MALPNGSVSPIESGDWTSDIAPSAHLDFFRSVNWKDSELGGLETWGPALRNHVYTLLADSRPACIYWGPRKVAIYNASFAPLAGKTHPRLMGITYMEAFPEIWEPVRPVFEYAETTRTAGEVNYMPLMVMRNDFLEETIFQGSFIPIRGDSGRVEGFYNCTWEKTRDVIRERRTAMLNNISSPSEMCDTSNIGQHIIRQLEANANDISMAVLYRIVDAEGSDEIHVQMAGSIGLPDNHQFATESFIASGLFPMPLLMDARGKAVDSALAPGFANVNWQGFGEPSSTISTIPLQNAGRLFGFLIIGANPRRPINPDHHQLTADLGKHVSSAFANVVGVEEARKRQERLEKELAFSERQLRYLCEHASISMANFKITGELLWANDQYYNIMGFEKSEENDSKSFMEYIHPDSHEETARLFASLVVDSKPVSLEIKLTRLFTPPVGPPEPAHALAWGFPYVEEGRISTLMSVMTDISRLKWAEKWQARAAEEARAAKRNQDQFIDSISHEIRNPLSAIFQLADKISSCVSDHGYETQTVERARAILEENIEAAKTILLCAKHQKRIVDDVLTISKLDFLLLTLTPIPVSPPDMVRSAARMFDADAATQSISLEVAEDPSLAANTVKWVSCDPSRLLQIFINLMTNAIKFTKNERRERKITVTYAACTSNPRSYFPPEMLWAPESNEGSNIDLALQALPPSDTVYLLFQIADTGAGIKDREIHNIFARFSQASVRTFVKYGGSGLGLYISQRLAEKQGGEIGVMSTYGRGSTFAFYIKCSRTEQPPTLENVTNMEVPARPLSGSLYTSKPHSPMIPAADTFPSPTISTENIPLVTSVTAGPAAPDAIHVLLVEDNLVNQQVLRKQLAKQGCVVLIANHGVEALEVLQTTDCWRPVPDGAKRLDFILMDWEMPVMNGLDCSREIRKLEAVGKVEGAHGRVEIIAITANARREQISTALEAGVDEVLPKPFMVRDLMRRMADRLSKSRLVDGHGMHSPLLQ